MTSRFGAILFDAGGIFVLPDPHVLAPLLAYYGGTTDHDAHIRAHYAGMAVKSHEGHAERDWSAYNLEYVRHVGVPGEAEELAAEVLGRTRNVWIWRWPVVDSVETLRTLVKREVPVGVVSNASGQIERVLRDSAVCQVGDGPGVPVRVVVDSEVVGVAKPDPAIFDFALPSFEGIDRADDRLRRRLGGDGRRWRPRSRAAPDPARPLRRPSRRRLRAHRTPQRTAVARRPDPGVVALCK